ncbi:MAG: DNA adenine methylase [Candidatus Heimdallarchaeota archaeon]
MTKDFVEIKSRRFLGNKYRLIPFIKNIVEKKCGTYNTVIDIFAGTGVVGESFNNKTTKIISNDILISNFISLSAWLRTTELDITQAKKIIKGFNNLNIHTPNYVSEKFGDRYFTMSSARKIGEIRELIENYSDSLKNVLLTSLLYALDSVANTVGHYDMYRMKLDNIKKLNLKLPLINTRYNENNEVYQKDGNDLIREISGDILYLDPPYNSRQYSDCYHVLENIVEWKKPRVYGKAQKMIRDHIKSEYNKKEAVKYLENLIEEADTKHILLSYNSTRNSHHPRSNAKISDDLILEILRHKGEVKIYQKQINNFSAGKSNSMNHHERVFYCKVSRN